MAQNVNVVIHFSTNRQGNLAKIALPSVLQKGCGGAMRPTPEDVVIPIGGPPQGFKIQMSIPGGRLALCSAPGSANFVGWRRYQGARYERNRRAS